MAVQRTANAQRLSYPGSFSALGSAIHQKASGGPRTEPVPGVGSLCPALRAIPFPQVTERFCRLPSSTLLYRPEAANLGDLMRLWVRPGVDVCHPSEFQGRSAVFRMPRRPKHLTSCSTLSPDDLLPGAPTVQKKRKLFPEPPGAYPNYCVSPGSIHIPVEGN